MISNELILRAIGPLMFVAIGWGIASFLKRRRGATKLPKWPIVLGGILAAVGVFNIVGRSLIATQEASSVNVMRVEQPTNGATAADITPTFVEESAALILHELKQEIPEFDATAASSVIEQDGKRLGVIRLKTGDVVPWISVVGISGDKFVRVTCAVSNLSNVDVGSPECARALRADFGTSIDG